MLHGRIDMSDDMLNRLRELISSDDVRGIRRFMTGLDVDAIEMRELLPFGGLLPEGERRCLEK